MRFMIKRIISAVLAGALWAGCMLPCLTGCAGSSGADSYTVAEWLDKVETDFNMLYYTSEEPFFPNVTSSNEDFDTVQIAAEWGLVDPEQGIRLADKVTKEFAADTLVSAMAFDYDASAEIADSDKISDLQAVSIAVSEGIFTLDGGSRFSPEKILTRAEADEAAAAAYEKWVGLTYAENYNKSAVKPEVLNFGGLAADEAEPVPVRYTVEYSGDLGVIDENGNYSDNSDKKIHIDAGQNIDVKQGSVLTLPADSQTPTAFAVVVDSITENADGSRTLNTHKAELYEVYDSVDVQYSGELDLSEAVVYDMQGNRLSGGVESDNVIYSGGNVIANSNGQPQREYLGTKKVKGSGSISLGKDVKVNYKVSASGVSFSIDTKIGKDVKVKFEKSTTIGIDAKLDWKWKVWRPDIKSARFVLNMNDHLGGKFSYSHDFAANNGMMAFSDGGVLTGDDLEEFYKVVSSAISLLDKDMGKAAGELNAPLFKFVVPTPIGIDAEFIVRLNLSLSGEISFTVDTNARCGVEYTKKNLRPVAQFSNSKSLDMKAKAELRLFLGAGVGLLGFTAIDAGVNLGVGARVNSKFYQLDTVTGSVVQECAMPTGMFGGTQEGGSGLSLQLSEEMKGCVDFIAYPIVELQFCTSNCLIGKAVNGLSYTVLGENDPFYTFHYETDNGVVKSCTRGKGDSFQIEQGSNIELNNDTLALAVGEKYEKLKVTKLPKGYTANDLVFSVDKGDIASVQDCIHTNISVKGLLKLISNSGGAVNYSEKKYRKYSGEDKKQMELTGLADGVAVVTVSTKDGLYSAQCTLNVGNGGIIPRTTSAFVIDAYALSLVPGQSGQVTVKEVPDGYDISKVTYVSEDESVAKVSGNGTVTAVGEGQTTIVISTEDGKYRSVCMIFVSGETSAV